MGKASGSGSAGARKWTKVPVAFRPDGLSKQGAPVDGQQAIDALADEWADIWELQQAWNSLHLQMVTWPEDLLQPLPRPSVSQVRRASKGFKEFTGIGCDDWHPRHVGMLSDDAIEAFISLLMAMERQGIAPEQVQVLLIVFLDKPDGGKRPIGLLASILRIWGKLRRSYANEWERDNARSYFWGGAAKGAEQCVWHQALRSEWASGAGQCSASALLDLAKCYEKVKHGLLADKCQQHGFNAIVARLAISLYAGPRRLVANGAVSRQMCTKQGILAGCTFATTLLRVLLISSCDATALHWPSIRLGVFVDDASLQAVGLEEFVVTQLSESTAFLAECFEQDLFMQVSRAKSVLLGSSRALAMRLAARLRRWGFMVADNAKNLGCDFASGKRIKRSSQIARRMKSQRRLHRFKVLRKAGASLGRVAHSGLSPACAYGFKVTGMPDGELQRVRRLVRAATALKVHGKSLTLALMLDSNPQLDPAFAANRGPVQQWASIVWSKAAPIRELQVAFDQALRVAGQAPWKQVRGPAGATVATLQRLGWKAKNAVLWETHTGQALDLRKTCPVTVSALVDQGTVAWQWKQVAKSEGLQDLADGGVLGPIRALLRPSGSGWTLAHAAALKSTVVNGQWPQQRLAEAGYVTDGTCQLCLAAAGTLRHRHWECDGTAALRRHAVDDGVLAASRGPLADIPLWSRALFPDPAKWLQPPTSIPMTYWFKEPSDTLFTGSVYIDGSGSHPTQPALRRIGFGIAAVDSRGHLTGAAYGPAVYFLQNVPASELIALLTLLRHSLPPLAPKSDCQMVVDGIHRGRVWCTAADRPYADLWAEIWEVLDGYGQ